MTISHILGNVKHTGYNISQRETEHLAEKFGNRDCFDGYLVDIPREKIISVAKKEKNCYILCNGTISKSIVNCDSATVYGIMVISGKLILVLPKY